MADGYCRNVKRAALQRGTALFRSSSPFFNGSGEIPYLSISIRLLIGPTLRSYSVVECPFKYVKPATQTNGTHVTFNVVTTK